MRNGLAFEMRLIPAVKNQLPSPFNFTRSAYTSSSPHKPVLRPRTIPPVKIRPEPGIPVRHSKSAAILGDVFKFENWLTFLRG